MIQVGHVIKRHGLKGELKVCLDIPLPQHTKALFICRQNRPTPFFIEYITALKNTTVIVKLEEIDNPEEATKMAQKAIYLPRHALGNTTPKKEVPSRLLIGYHVVQNAQHIGSVKAINEFVRNPLLVMQTPNKDILVPFNDYFVKKIDNEKKEITVTLPDGLIDL